MGSSPHERLQDEFIVSPELSGLLPVYQAYEYMIHSPAGGDERTSRFAEAAQLLMHQEPRFIDALVIATDFRQERGRPTPAPYLANLSMRAAQHLLRERRDYGHISNSAEGWRDGITHLLDREEKEIDIIGFTTLMMNQEIQTVVDARYKAAQLYVALQPHRFSGPIRYLDKGTSAGTGAKALISGQIKHRVGVSVVAPPQKPSSAYPQATLQSNERLTEYVHEKLGHPLEFEIAVGADITDPQNEDQREWIKSCYYPSEVVENKNKMITKFDHLAQMNLPNWLPLRQIDCADPYAPDEIRERSGVEEFDLITIFTMLDQLTEAQRVQIIKNSLDLLSPQGTLLMSDFAQIDKTMPSGLRFYDTRYPYTYHTAEFNRQTTAWEDVFWWRDGRCTDVIIAPSANFLTGHTPLELLN